MTETADASSVSLSAERPGVDPSRMSPGDRRWLFVSCFIALIATSFAFIIRAMILGDWGDEFGLTETQKGEIFGAGLYPFAISIVVFSLVIDWVGYGRAMVFAFLCHVASAIITILADGYWGLYWGNFVAALGNGTVEAVINPVIATIYANRNKTKWLNILHAGWPGGLVIGGLLTLSMNPGGLFDGFAEGAIDWRWKVGLLLIPTAVYGVMMLRTRFPVQERVAAGVPYRDMLRQFGGLGALIAFGLIFLELSRVWNVFEPWGFGWPWWATAALVAAVAGGFWAYTGTPGRWLFVFLLLVMILLAITELGTDGWIKELMEPVMRRDFGISGGWVLIYTATIMMVLRLSCGPIVKLLNPLGLLAVSCVFAAAGLAFLSRAAGLSILLAATVYGIGQTFFWPTTLGLIAERFPRGGALTLNAIAGVGMLGVGIFGTPLLGLIQDRTIDRELLAQDAALHAQVASEPATSVLGAYRTADPDLEAALPEADQARLKEIREGAKQNALLQVAVLPCIMLACYLGLLIYFKRTGGYKALSLTDGEADAEQRGPPRA